MIVGNDESMISSFSQIEKLRLLTISFYFATDPTNTCSIDITAKTIAIDKNRRVNDFRLKLRFYVIIAMFRYRKVLFGTNVSGQFVESSVS